MALYRGDNMPSALIPLPGGTRDIGAFFLAFGGSDLPIVVRYTTADGRVAPASVPVIPSATEPAPLTAPTISADGTAIRLCNGVAGDRAVLMAAGTELAISVASVSFGTDGCAEFPRTSLPAHQRMIST